MTPPQASVRDARAARPGLDAGPAIEALGVEKVYGATVALADAELVTHPGEIHALLGENGAGKSTLVRILAGVEAPDAGTVRLFGEAPAAAAGCAFIHQDLALFPTMSVAANIALAGGFRRRRGLIDERATVAEAGALLDRLGMRINPRMLVGELPLADQTAVAIARALSRGVRLIVLDEPTAYLEARQVRNLLALLGRLRSEGVACLLITHRAGDVLTSCDALTVLRDGRTVAARAVHGMTERALVELISGHAAAERPATGSTKAGKDVLRVDAALGRGFGPISLTVGAGEIVAVCGLADAGTADLGRALFGLTPLEAGELWLDGQAYDPASPAAAAARGVAYVPSERRAAALAEMLSAQENIFMRPSGRWWAPIRVREERALARAQMEGMGVYPVHPEHLMSTFSGGNQQKIVLAKWLRTQPRLLVLNDPTAGVDLAAKAEIHERLRSACATRGLGVLLITSDFTEVAELADRVYVMRRQLLVDEIDGSTATPDRLVALAYGGTET